MGGHKLVAGLVVHLPERLAHLPRALRTVPAPRLAKPGGGLLTLSKAVDQRIWPHQHTLRQFEATLSPDTLHKLEERKATVERL